MRNLNLMYKVDLKNSIDEFYIEFLLPKIFSLNLIYDRGTFYVEKRKYLVAEEDKDLSFNEIFFLIYSDFDLQKIYNKLENNINDYNEDILDFAKHLNIFGDGFEVTENLIDEMRTHFSKIIHESINSIRIANFSGNIYLLIFRDKERKFLFYEMSSFVSKITDDLKKEFPANHPLFPKFNNYDDVPSAKYTLIYNTNIYFLANFLFLFDEKITKYYCDNYQIFKNKSSESWESERGDIIGNFARK